MSQTRQFRAPVVISTGIGAAKEAGEHAKQLGKRALIVTDSNLEKIGLLADVKASLDASGVADRKKARSKYGAKSGKSSR